MKGKIYLLLAAAASLCLLGCKTSTPAGGASDDTYSTTGWAASPSPTMRPGMNPTDPRDPTYLSHPPFSTGNTP